MTPVIRSAYTPSLSLWATYIAFVGIRLVVLRGVEIELLLALELLFSFAMTATMGLTTIRRILRATPGYLLGGIVALAWPEWAPITYGIAHWVALGPVILASAPPAIAELEAARAEPDVDRDPRMPT